MSHGVPVVDSGSLSHTLILLGCLTVGWGISAVVMRIAPGLPRWGDRRALHQLALFSPLLTLVLAGGWSLWMAVSGCLQFSTQDGIGTILLMSLVIASLAVAAVRESWRIHSVRRSLESLSDLPTRPDLEPMVQELASKLGGPIPTTWMLEVNRPIAFVTGVRRPVLFISRWILEHFSDEELRVLIAHELAHLRHLDNLLAWLDVILLRAFAFLPPLRRAWQESLAEREEAADVVAAALTLRPLVLAHALVKVADWEKEAHGTLRMAGASSFNDDLSLLERRVERLVQFDPAQNRAWGLPTVVAAACAAGLPFVTAALLGFATSCIGH